ncbi:uncharacterized protein [Nicotiana tomentosiformis]|uniref:uncharacterized protein n=1 Tax=Nicotiana tomentosiformis TaxID=4098 RepID=UPI00388CB7D9
MAKTSKSVPQKETPSSSKPTENILPFVAEEPTPEPLLKMFVPTRCLTRVDFKVEQTSSVPGRCEPVSRYICSVTDSVLDKVKDDCNWVSKHVVVPMPDEAITTHVEGLPKDVEMSPPSGDEDILPEPSVPRQDKEKKRKRVPSSPNSEKKKPKRRLVCKSKESASARDVPSDSLNRLRDESEEEEEAFELMTHVRSGIESPQTREGDGEEIVEASEFGRVEPVLPRAKEVDRETVADASQASVLQHKTFLRYRKELNQHEAETRDLTEKRDAYKFLSEKFQAELEAARKEHADLVEQAKADERVDQHKADVEAAQDQVRNLVEHMKWKS